jgi:putative addiction module component (TIGR02574 family)
MSIPLKQVEAEALELSVRERAQLVQRLIASLDEDAGENPAEIEHAWEAEIRRRLQEYRTGRVETIPATEVFAEARARLRR